MQITLPEKVKSELRFVANYKTHKPYLLKLDANRFRGLGNTRSRNFVRKATEFSDSVGLRYMEEVEYIIFLMSYLGTYFHQDPRYSEFSRVLHQDITGRDTRIEQTHKLFAAFANRFIGDDLGLYRQALMEFSTRSEQVLQSDHPVTACFDSFFAAYRFDKRLHALFPTSKMLNNARLAAQELAIPSETGVVTCLSLSFWLGAGFYKDPLYPWVRDKTCDMEGSQQKREKALIDYANKRLAKQIDIGEM